MKIYIHAYEEPTDRVTYSVLARQMGPITQEVPLSKLEDGMKVKVGDTNVRVEAKKMEVKKMDIGFIDMELYAHGGLMSEDTLHKIDWE